MTKLSDLTLDAKNANRGTQRGLKALTDSLQKYGAGRSILVDKDGNVIAGNKYLFHLAINNDRYTGYYDGEVTVITK